jgi:hypothetical protein
MRTADGCDKNGCPVERRHVDPMSLMKARRTSGGSSRTWTNPWGNPLRVEDNRGLHFRESRLHTAIVGVRE